MGLFLSTYVSAVDSEVEGGADVFALGRRRQSPRFAARNLRLPRRPRNVVQLKNAIIKKVAYI